MNILFVCTGNTCRSPMAEGYLKSKNLENINVWSRGLAADGFVTTLFGRRRYLPELNNSNGMLRAFGERVARNAPIQGTAADIIKLAMIKVYDRLGKEIPTARLILQVHDELIVECDECDAEKVCKLLSEEMSGAAKLLVNLTADAAYGKTWLEAKG